MEETLLATSTAIIEHASSFCDYLLMAQEIFKTCVWGGAAFLIIALVVGVLKGKFNAEFTAKNDEIEELGKDSRKK